VSAGASGAPEVAHGEVRPAGRPGRRTEPPPRPLLAAAIRVLLRGLSLLSLPALHRLGRLAGTAARIVPTKAARNTRESLAIAFPETPASERERLFRESLVHASCMTLEHAAFWFWDRDRVLSLFRSVEGDGPIREARAAGRGVIVAGTHLGAIEAVHTYCSTQFGMSSQYRKPRIRELDSLFRDARERFGGHLLPIGPGSVRAVVRALREGNVIGVPCDQDPGVGAGVFVPFFGRLTNTMTLVSRLAALTGALVVVSYAVRMPRGEGFDVRFRTAPPEVASDDLAVSAAALNRAVEECVRLHPEQYLWSYRRFRIVRS
jgi:KDO2-lipid IV(A) lauroyltransferase